MMPTVSERAIVVPRGRVRLRGILHAPAAPAELGVLVIVGGPQYRVGSHRQFVLLARALAAGGVVALRFDHSGIGDSEGDAVGFERLDADVRAAIDALCANVPSVKRVVIWALCDGASAAAFYARSDSRVAGLVLLNPWVRSDVSQAATLLRSYYLQRLLTRAFWAKVLGGAFDPLRSLRSIFANVASVFRGSTSVAGGNPLAQRLAAGLAAFSGSLLIVLSGRDLTAREFSTSMERMEQWRRIAASPQTKLVHLPEADHTFSRQEWRDTVARITLEWVLECRIERS